MLVTALNLRMSVASVPPLIDDIKGSLSLSSAAAGALTTLPVVCMGVGAALAPRVARRYGYEVALAGIGLAMATGILVRLAPGVAALYLGTTIAGMGIALGNVLVPTVVKRDFHARVGAMTGAYTMAIAGSAGLAAGLTVPFEDAIGHGWRPALAVWALPALPAAAVWIPFSRRPLTPRDEVAAGTGSHGPTRFRRDRLAWQVTLFMGLQSLTFYSLLSWLPSLLQAHGVSKGASGAYLSVFALLGIPACLAVPIIGARLRDQRPLVAASVGLLVIGVIGLLVAPRSGAVAWTLCTGIAQGANLGLAFLFFGMRTRDQAAAASLSSMAQSVGYLMAAAGPLALGVLHQVSGGWTAPLLFVLVLLVPELLTGLASARERLLG